jgi:putative redox protein
LGSVGFTIQATALKAHVRAEVFAFQFLIPRFLSSLLSNCYFQVHLGNPVTGRGGCGTFGGVMAVEVDIVYEGALHCAATHGPSQQTLVTDAPVDNGGKGAAFSPTDLVATALGSCMATIMGLVAQRNQLDIAGLKILVTKEMVADPVRRIGSLNTRLVFPPGKRYSVAERAKLEAGARSCPVKQSLHPDIKVGIEFVYPE